MIGTRFISLALFFFAGGGMLYAQNWAPFNSSEKFNYYQAGSTSIDRTCYVISSTEVNGDSLHHFSPIMEACDACTTAECTSAPNQCVYYKNRPSLFHRALLVQANGKYQLQDPDNWVIFAEASLGFSWVMDSINNDTATISRVFQTTIFSQSDSVKTIMLSNGDSILLSKNYGLLEIPDMKSNERYLLAGIHGRELGDLVPGFWEIYDLQVGDMIQWQESGYSGGTPTDYQGDETLSKFTVLSRNVSGNTITLNVQEVYHHKTFYADYSFNVFVGANAQGVKTVNWVFDSIPSGMNFYPREKCAMAYALQSLEPGDSSYVPMELQRDGSGRYQKIISYLAPFGNGNSAYTTISGSDSMPQVPWMGSYNSEYYKDGLGLVAYEWFWFEAAGSRVLHGYYKADDSLTVGYFTPDSVILTNEKLVEPVFEVYPNPATDLLHLKFENERIRMASIRDIDGKSVLRQQRLERDPVIDLTDIPAGIYFLTVTDEKGGFDSRKIMINR